MILCKLKTFPQFLIENHEVPDYFIDPDVNLRAKEFQQRAHTITNVQELLSRNRELVGKVRELEMR